MATQISNHSKELITASYSQPLKVISSFKPSGDQPEAIKKIVKGINRGEEEQVLLGVTGSGKTYAMVKVIET